MTDKGQSDTSTIISVIIYGSEKIEQFNRESVF